MNSSSKLILVRCLICLCWLPVIIPAVVFLGCISPFYLLYELFGRKKVKPAKMTAKNVTRPALTRLEAKHV